MSNRKSQMVESAVMSEESAALQRLMDQPHEEFALLTLEDAELLTSWIKKRLRAVRVELEDIHHLLLVAFEGRAYKRMGCSTWKAYCRKHFGDVPELPKGNRQHLARRLSRSGMSNRAIADGLGVSEATVRRDVAVAGPGASGDAPDVIDAEIISESFEPAHDEQQEVRRVTGADGKSYPAAPAQHGGAPAAPELALAKFRKQQIEQSAYAYAFAESRFNLWAENRDLIAQLPADDLRVFVADLEKSRTFHSKLINLLREALKEAGAQ